MSSPQAETCNIPKQKHNTSFLQKKDSSIFPHNGTLLLLNMLISHSLKCPYLQYEHCLQTHQKKSQKAREKSNLLFSVHQRYSAAGNCVCQKVQCQISATEMLHYNQTSPFHSVSHSDAGCDHEKTDPLRNMFLWFYKR